MKYDKSEYEEAEFYGCEEDGVENHQQKLVKCVKPHTCVSCQKEIQKGENALRETGFMPFDGPVSCYTCIPCLDKWLDEINGDESEADHGK
jgi:hypothetical protein